MNADLSEEEKANFKKNNVQITQLNTMLKKMVPLYEKRGGGGGGGAKITTATTPIKPGLLGTDKTPVTVIGSKVVVSTLF